MGCMTNKGELFWRSINKLVFKIPWPSNGSNYTLPLFALSILFWVYNWLPLQMTCTSIYRGSELADSLSAW